MVHSLRILRGTSALAVALIAATTGCTAFMAHRDPVPVTPADPPTCSNVPRELEKSRAIKMFFRQPTIFRKVARLRALAQLTEV